MYIVVLSNRISYDLFVWYCIVMPCLVPVHCPAVICLPLMPCFLSKESTSSELWTPVQSLPLIHFTLLIVYLMQTITFHTIHLILCYSKTVSLTTSLIRWGKVLSLCCAGLRVASNTYVMFPFSYWFDNLGFLLMENLLLCCFTPCSWGSQWSASQHHQAFLAPLPGRLRTSSQGESFTSFLFTLFLVCFVSFAWFCLPLLKKTKKIV